jgi:hypothetical protein
LKRKGGLRMLAREQLKEGEKRNKKEKAILEGHDE